MSSQKQVKSVLNKQKKRDSWFLTDYSVNGYEGCSCNCLYCYVRGSKYGENMETGLVIKSNALEVLEKQLNSRARKGDYGFVAVGSATDAYTSPEETLRITEGMLKLLLKYRFPVFISTKSKGILRDIELLKEIDKAAILPEDLRTRLGRGVIIAVSLSTLDHQTALKLEPAAAAPQIRLEVLKEMKTHGFLAGVNAIPILPFISDSDEELEKIILAAMVHHADFILVGGLTLFGQGPSDSRTLYLKFLQSHQPSLVEKTGNLYGANFYPPRKYLDDLKVRAETIAHRHQIRTTILK